MEWPLFWLIVLQVSIASLVLRILVVPWQSLWAEKNEDDYITHSEKII